VTEEEELRSELDIRFDFKAFEFFFNTLYQCLEGDLGNQFFQVKTDFLMKLSYFIWKKYIVQAIVQQHHIYEMKLQDEIIDSHMLVYEKLADQLRPILIKGLKIMNRIIQ